MPSAPDRKYLSLFVGEAKEQLELLSGDLVRLEHETGAGARERWESIFRRVHSVKGSAATLELLPLVEVAHEAEALIDRLKAEAPTRVQVDLLLEVSDALAQLVREAATLLDAGAGDALPKSAGGPGYDGAPLVGRLREARIALGPKNEYGDTVKCSKTRNELGCHTPESSNAFAAVLVESGAPLPGLR